MAWRKISTFFTISTILGLALILGYPRHWPGWLDTQGMSALAAPLAIPDPVADRLLGQLDFTSTNSDVTDNSFM